MYAQKEQRWEQRFEINGEVKTYFPKSEEQMKRNLKVAQEKGYKKISSKKLYPFNTNKNQHNFNLINDLCYIEMREMEDGEREWNSKRYDELQVLKEKAERFFCLPLPIAWLTWEDWKDAKEISENAVFHRQEACIANGRYDLVPYC